MDQTHRWTIAGVVIVLLFSVGLVFLPFLGLLVAAVVAGLLVGFGGGAVPAVLHVSVFITVSAHDPNPQSLLLVGTQLMVVFGGLLLASVAGAVSIGVAAFVGYLRKQRFI